MKTPRLLVAHSLIPGILLLFFQSNLNAQVTISSTAGYRVDINVRPQTLLPSSLTSCIWGYNYNVKLSYQVAFTGSNIPASMYTLQGTVNCGATSNFFDLPNGGGVGTVNSTSNQWRSLADCATATLSTLNCNTVNIEISGLGISSRIVSYPITFTPLAVKLIDFKASRQGNNTKLDWASAAETNNEFYIVQRSVSGNQWTDLIKMPGAGNSTTEKEYVYTDQQPPAQGAYYRLKQLDINGEASFSNIVFVEAAQTTGNISIFPVPNATNNIRLSGITAYKNYTISLTDMNSNTIWSSESLSESVSLPDLKTGLYFLRIIQRYTRHASTLKYVKL